MTDIAQMVTGDTAREIAASLEAAIRQGTLRPGAGLPSVRQLAVQLGVSPPTVSAALADLRRRGVIVTRERRRSIVSPRPPVGLAAAIDADLPADAQDLARGNPDPDLLPRLGQVLKRIVPGVHLYGSEAVDPRLLQIARRELAASGAQPEDVCLVSGALDGVERVLAAHLGPGDRVMVEDPGYFAVFDLLRAMNLEPVPVGIDEYGLLPDALMQALRSAAQALVVTPRAQNPTGAALDATRAAALRDVLRAAPDVVLVEDDHQGPISGAPGFTLSAGRRHWAIVRSVAKSLGPDLRLAFVGGDAETIARVEGRQALGPGWVSHLLQRVVIELFRAPDAQQLLELATAVYDDRRRAVIAALAEHGISASGRSGFNVWVNVADEIGLVSRLLELGWAVAPGARYRLHSPPAVRITCAALPVPMAEAFAQAFAKAAQPPRRSRAA